MPGRKLVAVALGAAIGGGLRWLALTTIHLDPYVALLVVNTAASGLLGWVHISVRSGRLQRPELGALLGAGLCGTLSTWSALAVELGGDLRSGEVLRAAIWCVASVAAGIGAAFIGSRLTTPEAQP